MTQPLSSRPNSHPTADSGKLDPPKLDQPNGFKEFNPANAPNQPNEPQMLYLQRARASLKQSLNRYNGYFRVAKNRPPLPSQAGVKADMEQLAATLSKLEQQVLRIAVFGLVSRGKSAVLNALVGQKLLPTGPLNGVTLIPQVVRWQPYAPLASSVAASSLPLQSSSSLQIELIDTPGLDEIDGQTRAEMAQAIARQSDLILFVVAGDITRVEYDALCDLRRAQKPLVLVFNKIDLYPQQNRQAIYQSLQRLAAQSLGSAASAAAPSQSPSQSSSQQASQPSLQELLSVNEIVLVAADPMPIQVRVEQPNGSVSYEWESPPIQVDALKQKILQILEREGRTLMALNALGQVKDAESRLAGQLLELHATEAEAIIWKFMRYKAIAIALNPIAILDLAGGAVADLAMIRALSELYGLPITNYEASQLWKTIILSSGGLLLTEIGSGILLGMGKSAAAAAAGMDSSSGVAAYAGAAIAQAALAGFGSYSVGQATQVYLEQGCSWGPQGANIIIQEILRQLDRNTIIYRLKQELTEQFGLPSL